MTSNRELLLSQKADLALSDLASGGRLNPEQSNKFIRKLIVQPTIFREARVVEMNAPQVNINKIGFGSRILRKAVSATALTNTYVAATAGTGRSKPTTEQIVLNTDEYIAEVYIPYDTMEDNIERINPIGAETDQPGGSAITGGFRDTVLDLIVERVATDLEELCLLSDSSLYSGTDAFLASKDGWLKLAQTNGNVLNVNNAAISKSIFKDGLKAMPDQYLREKNVLRHYVSMDNEIEYADQLSNRATALGDAALGGSILLNAHGVPVKGVSLMPVSKGLLTHPKNLIVGIQRNISLEYEKDISARVYKIVLTIRMDVDIEEREAVVLYTNIGTAN